MALHHVEHIFITSKLLISKSTEPYWLPQYVLSNLTFIYCLIHLKTHSIVHCLLAQ